MFASLLALLCWVQGVSAQTQIIDKGDSYFATAIDTGLLKGVVFKDVSKDDKLQLTGLGNEKVMVKQISTGIELAMDVGRVGSSFNVSTIEEKSPLVNPPIDKGNSYFATAIDTGLLEKVGFKGVRKDDKFQLTGLGNGKVMVKQISTGKELEMDVGRVGSSFNVNR